MAKILIVDDEWLTRLEIEEMLKDLGYEVAGQAETGEEAVALTREVNPDLILMDVVMPGAMNGIDAARRIKAEFGTPIIFISGYGDPEYIEAAKKIEPFGYIMKPFDEKEVHAFVEIALSKRALELKLKRAHEGLERTNIVLHKEIMARKETERALRESEKLYRDIFERNNAVKWLVDPASGRIIDANPAACEFYQYSHEEITNLRIWDINVKSESDMKNLLTSANTGEKTEFVFQHRLASGEIRDVQVYTGALESGGRKLLHSIIIDITDRVRAEKALKEAHDELEKRVRLRTAELDEANKKLKQENKMHKRLLHSLSENEKKLNAVLDGVTETIILTDKNGTVQVANKTVCDRLKTTKEKLLGKNVFEFLPPEVAEIRRRKWNEVFETGKPAFFEDSREGMIFEHVAYPVFGEEDHVKMVVSFANDKTDRQRAVQALRETERHLKSLMESATNFAVYRLAGRDEDPNSVKVIFVSPSIKDIMGVSEPMNFGTWFENIHPDDVERIVLANREAFKTLRFDETVRVYHPQKKKWLWIHAVSTGFKDTDQQHYVNGILLEVTRQTPAPDLSPDSSQTS